MLLDRSMFKSVEGKRRYIETACNKYYAVNGSCPGCPFDSDDNAWCKVGFLKDIKPEDMDAIMDVFEKSFTPYVVTYIRINKDKSEDLCLGVSDYFVQAIQFALECHHKGFKVLRIEAAPQEE